MKGGKTRKIYEKVLKWSSDGSFFCVIRQPSIGPENQCNAHGIVPNVFKLHRLCLQQTQWPEPLALQLQTKIASEHPSCFQ